MKFAPSRSTYASFLFVVAVLSCRGTLAFTSQATAIRPNVAFQTSTLMGKTMSRPSSSLNGAVLSFAEVEAITEASSLAVSSAADILSLDNIKSAFNVATFGPQVFWLFLILLPNSSITKKMFGGIEIITVFSLVHFFIVTASIVQPDGTAPMAEFADVFDPAGDPQKAMVGMMQYPNFVSEEWSHVLTWDLFVGRWIWLDGLRRGIFTSHSVLLCNLIGPPGLLLHLATCLLTGKGLPPNDAEDIN